MIITINGLRRSGNHAMALWILNHFKGGISYYNSYNGKNTNPSQLFYGTGDQILELKHESRSDFVRNRIPEKIKAKHREVNKRKKFIDQIFFDSSSKNKKYCEASGIKIYGIENESVENILSFSEELKADKTILIIRDPINNLASLMKHRGVLLPTHKFVPLWNDYAYNWNNPNIVTIIYDKWFVNSDYRRLIESKLGLIETDNGLNDVHPTGMGSSFDGMEYQGKAQEMNVLKRWWGYRKNEEYLKVLNDSDLLKIREDIFGPLPVNLRKRIRQIDATY